MSTFLERMFKLENISHETSLRNEALQKEYERREELTAPKLFTCKPYAPYPNNHEYVHYIPYDNQDLLVIIPRGRA